MRSLLPTLKERKRYLLFEVSADVDKDACKDAIQQACLQMLGELGCAKAGISFLGENYNNNKGILRVDAKYVDEVKLSLSNIKEIEGQKATIKVSKVSGIIKKLKPLLN